MQSSCMLDNSDSEFDSLSGSSLELPDLGASNLTMNPESWDVVKSKDTIMMMPSSEESDEERPFTLDDDENEGQGKTLVQALSKSAMLQVGTPDGSGSITMSRSELAVERREREDRQNSRFLRTILEYTDEVDEKGALTLVAKHAMCFFAFLLRTKKGSSFRGTVKRFESDVYEQKCAFAKHLDESALMENKEHYRATRYVIRTLKEIKGPDFLADIECPPDESSDEIAKEWAKFPPPGAYRDVSMEDVVRTFNQDAPTPLPKGEWVQCGLAQEVADERQKVYGTNVLPRATKPSLSKTILKNFCEPVVLVLIVVCAITFGIQDWLAGTVIVINLLFNMVINIHTQYSPQKKLADLFTEESFEVEVFRDGRRLRVDYTELVPGDICFVRNTPIIPADMQVLEGQASVSETALTGKSSQISKGVNHADETHFDIRNIVYMGTKFSNNSPPIVAIVTATGKYTEMGKIYKSISEDKPKPTFLEEKLRHFSAVSGILAFILGVVYAIVEVVFGTESKGWEDHLVHTIEVALSVLSEDLVFVMTMTYYLSGKDMHKIDTLCKHGPASEAIGCVQRVVLSRTGTVTTGYTKADMLCIGKTYMFDRYKKRVDPKGEIINFPLIREVVPENARVELWQEEGVKSVKSNPRANMFTSKFKLSMLVCSMCQGKNYFKCSRKEHEMYESHNKDEAVFLAAEQTRFNHRSWKKEWTKLERKKQDDESGYNVADLPNTTWVVVSRLPNVKKTSFGDNLENIDDHFADEEYDDPWCECLPCGIGYKQSCIDCHENLASFLDGEDVQETSYRTGWVFEESRYNNIAGEFFTLKDYATDGSVSIDEASEFVMCRGPVEEVIYQCTAFMTEDEKLINLNARKKDTLSGDLLHVRDKMKAMGMDVQCLAFRALCVEDAVSPDDPDEIIEKYKDKMILLGFIGLTDPPKFGVKESIVRCRNMGVDVFLMTGDNLEKGEATALQIGLLDYKGKVKNYISQNIKGDHIEGRIFEANYVKASNGGYLEEEKKEKKWSLWPKKKGTILEESGQEINLADREKWYKSLKDMPHLLIGFSMKQKKLLIDSLERNGIHTAMVGESSNDAPAMKRATSSISMAHGSEIAKEVGSISFEHGNVANVPDAIKVGRDAYDNFKKFFVGMVSGKISEVLTFFVSAVSILPAPLSVLRVLFVNVVVDLPSTLSMLRDPPEYILMTRRPRNPQASFLSPTVWVMVALQGIFMTALTMLGSAFYMFLMEPHCLDLARDSSFVYPTVEAQLDAERALMRARTFGYNVFVWISAMHGFVGVSVYNSVFIRYTRANRILLAGTVVGVGLIFVSYYVPFLRDLLEQGGLLGYDWLLLLCFAFIYLLLTEAVKLVIRLRMDDDTDEDFYDEDHERKAWIDRNRERKVYSPCEINSRFWGLHIFERCRTSQED